MTPAFEQAAFALKPGQTSESWKRRSAFTSSGQSSDARSARRPSRKSTGQIKEFLTRGQREKKLADFVAQFKTKARIEILV